MPALVGELQVAYRAYGLTVRSGALPFEGVSCNGRGVDLVFEPGPQSDPLDDSLLICPSCRSRHCLPDGRSALLLYRGDHGDLIRFTAVADFAVSQVGVTPGVVTYWLRDPAQAHMVEVQFLGTVLAFWLERAGIPALHASAVVLDGEAVGFMATSRGGKSCLAGAFLQAGCPLLTDDILPAEETAPGEFVGRPGYPSMRFWPDEATHFIGGCEHLPLVVPGVTKRRVAIGEGFGSFHDAAAPIRCFYVPERRPPDDPDPEVRITPVSRGEALMLLLSNSFIPLLVEGLGIQGERMQRLGRLVCRVPVRRLSYPSGLEELPRVREAILGDLAGVLAANERE